jgi:hypothetical protein
MSVDYVRVYQKGLGTPVPDTVIVTPANQLVLAGKTIQYTAKVLDQNGHVMALAPEWSVTGAGNTITTGGLATLDTSGVITATATGASGTSEFSPFQELMEADLIVTEHATFSVDEGGLVLEEVAPSSSYEWVRSHTPAPFRNSAALEVV